MILFYKFIMERIEPNSKKTRTARTLSSGSSFCMKNFRIHPIKVVNAYHFFEFPFIRRLKLLLCSMLLFSNVLVFSQRNSINTYNVITLNTTYGMHFSGGDLSNRFGTNFGVGGGIDFITEKKNWIIGIKGNNLFGNTVKEDVLASLRDSDGFILGSVGAGQATYADVFLRARGFYAGGHFGKLFPILKKNKRAGIRLTIGTGLLQHKVRIQDETGTADQLKGEQIKGYDQLTNGLAFEQFIGYQQLSRKTGVNFFAGFELTEAFTKNRRAINFTSQSQDNTARFDVLLGFKIGWSFTFYIGERAEDIQY